MALGPEKRVIDLRQLTYTAFSPKIKEYMPTEQINILNNI